MARFSKKHYEFVAETLREIRSFYGDYSKTKPQEVFDDVTKEFADRFAADNSRFDRERFFRASLPKG